MNCNTSLVGKKSTLRRKNGPKIINIFPLLHFASVVAEAEGIEPLMNTLNAQRDGAVANAIAVLINLSLQEPSRVSIRSRGIMSALAGPLRSTNSQVQSKAAFAVAAFGCDADARAEVKLLFEVVVIDNVSRSEVGVI